VDYKTIRVILSPGQQITQTDIGLLIRNIFMSLSDLFLGDLNINEDQDRAIIRVLPDNPFKKGSPPPESFTIDKKLWLPDAVEESSASGVLKRKVVYQYLRTNMGIEDSFFKIE
jgi:outer membrane lipoprotein-sorting protein